MRYGGVGRGWGDTGPLYKKYKHEVSRDKGTKTLHIVQLLSIWGPRTEHLNTCKNNEKGGGWDQNKHTLRLLCNTCTFVLDIVDRYMKPRQDSIFSMFVKVKKKRKGWCNAYLLVLSIFQKWDSLEFCFTINWYNVNFVAISTLENWMHVDITLLGTGNNSQKSTTLRSGLNSCVWFQPGHKQTIDTVLWTLITESQYFFIGILYCNDCK